MAMSSDKIQELILQAIPDAKIKIKDLVGDDDHYAVEVTSKQFAGLSRVQQHQMVYNSLNGNMGTALHALSISTKIG